MSQYCPRCQHEFATADLQCANCGLERPPALQKNPTTILNQPPQAAESAVESGVSSDDPENAALTGGFPPVPDRPAAAPPRSDAAGAAPTFWTCAQCVSLNPSDSDYCETCGALQPSVAPVKLSASQMTGHPVKAPARAPAPTLVKSRNPVPVPAASLAPARPDQPNPPDDGTTQKVPLDLINTLSAMRQEAAPAAAPLNFTSSSFTDEGVSRKGAINEDSLLTLDLQRAFENRFEHFGFYIVCDGMGGQAAGEIASRMAIQDISSMVTTALAGPWLNGQHLTQAYAGQILQQAIMQAHQQLREYNRREERDAGTTLTACCVVDNWAVFANVGDSRTYLFRQGNPALAELNDDTTDPVLKVIQLPGEPALPANRVTLRLNDPRTPEPAKSNQDQPAAPAAPRPLIPERVTHDHSLVQHLVDRGELTLEEVYNDPRRNVILFALGAPDERLPVDIFHRDLQDGDIILLCSDGLWEMVRDPEMVETIMAQPDLAQCARDLVDLANTNGGADNVTVVLVRADAAVEQAMTEARP